MNPDRPPTPIAIDGPAASGKTTVGQLLAERLGYLFVDTGCMYRAATLMSLQRGIDLDDEAAVVEVTRSLNVVVQPAGTPEDGRIYTVLMDGKDVTWEIRTASVDRNVSQVSAYKGVREILVQRQREIAAPGRVIVVGRDIGTVVLPNAPLKLYVIASAEERAKRRWAERRERDLASSYKQILDDIRRRDAIDGTRQYGPMRPAPDAIVIDTTGRSPEEILKDILMLAHFRSFAGDG